MARVERISLCSRQMREQLSEAAIAQLFACAEMISEGRSDGAGRFFGSMMWTLDVEQVAHRLRGVAQEGGAAQIAALMQADRRVQKRLRELAESSASERAGFFVGVGPGDLQLRAVESRVLVDVDLEGALKERSA